MNRHAKNKHHDNQQCHRCNHNGNGHWDQPTTLAWWEKTGMTMAMIAICRKCTIIKTKGKTLLAANSINNIGPEKKESKQTTQHKRTNTKKHDSMQHKCNHYTTIHIKIGWVLTENDLVLSSPDATLHRCTAAASHLWNWWSGHQILCHQKA